MALHSVIQAALAAGQQTPPYHALPIGEARAQAKKGYQAKRVPVPVGEVREVWVPAGAAAITARIYTPPAAPGEESHPLVVFFHGSGFVMLDLDSHDDICRRLCAGAACIVVSVDYRLAPEHRFPAAPDDCLAATRRVAAHARELGGDAARIALAGDRCRH